MKCMIKYNKIQKDSHVTYPLNQKGWTVLGRVWYLLPEHPKSIPDPIFLDYHVSA